MHFRLLGYGKLFRLKSFSDQLYLSTGVTCRPTRSPTSAFGQSLPMQPHRHATGRSYTGAEPNLRDKVETFGTVPASAEGFGPPLEKKRVGNKLVDEIKFSAMSSMAGANCDEDSEAETFKDGRSEEVDSETRGRAFVWCRDFLSGSWKTLDEDDFQISIVR